MRTERYFCISGQWFFATREMLQVGPFASREDAEVALMLFLRHVGEGGIYADLYGLNQQRWGRYRDWLS